MKQLWRANPLKAVFCWVKFSCLEEQQPLKSPLKVMMYSIAKGKWYFIAEWDRVHPVLCEKDAGTSPA